MPIVVPGRRIGTAFSSNSAMKKRLNKGKKSTYAALMLTSMVDMFTILVLYLIQQFNATGQILFIDPDLRLPEAKMGRDVIGNPPVVSVDRTQIAVGGKTVEDTSVLEKEGAWEAPQLEQALTEIMTTAKGVEDVTQGQYITEAAQGLLVVQADVTVPYRLVKKIMMIAQKAGFHKIDFAVTQKVADIAELEKPAE